MCLKETLQQEKKRRGDQNPTPTEVCSALIWYLIWDMNNESPTSEEQFDETDWSNAQYKHGIHLCPPVAMRSYLERVTRFTLAWMKIMPPSASNKLL